MPNGQRRSIDASWTIGDDGTLAGTLRSHA
jgi:hypothetical protein